jgi:hypothetical protein
LLCIEDRNPPALSDIVALASLPAWPDTIYALTSHTGLLFSTDAGATFGPLTGIFDRHPAGIPELEADNRPARLVVSEENGAPVFWLAYRKDGLLVYRDGRWTRLDGQADGGCAGLPTLTVTSLLVTKDEDPRQGKAVVIGSDQRGLWVSADGGRTCRRVLDAAGNVVFYGLWDVSPPTLRLSSPLPPVGDFAGQAHGRYLALVLDTTVEPGDPLGTWRLLDLCPRLTSCSPADWRPEPEPLWHASAVVADAFVQRSTGGDYEWFLVTQFGQIWRGDLAGAEQRPLTGINRCLISTCVAAFAPGPPGGYPYLLAATIVDRRTEKLLASGRVYRYTEGPWWRRLWP